MSKDWVEDIRGMHDKFGVMDRVQKMDKQELLRFLDFRLKCIKEEVDETEDAFLDSDPEGLVDGILDNIVFSIGTLLILGVDPNKSWDEILRANMSKRPGVKKGRPNPFGFPDLLKPADWIEPSHQGNHGSLKDLF